MTSQSLRDHGLIASAAADGSASRGKPAWTPHYGPDDICVLANYENMIIRFPL